MEHAVGEDGVSLKDDSGATMTAARGEVHLNGASQPQTGVLTGNVRYATDDSMQKTSAETDLANADFDKTGLLKHVVDRPERCAT